jgi:putative addiction module component (TIGR02574 family)
MLLLAWAYLVDLLEAFMGAMLDELEAQALKLPLRERSELVHRLLVSLDGEPDGTPEEIAQAWDEEIARRVADMEAGRTRWVPAEEVMVRVRARIEAARASADAG